MTLVRLLDNAIVRIFFWFADWNQVFEDFLCKAVFDIYLYSDTFNSRYFLLWVILIFKSKCIVENRINGFTLYGTTENGTVHLIYSDEHPTQNRAEIFIDSSHMLDIPIKVITIAGPNTVERILTLCEVFIYGILSYISNLLITKFNGKWISLGINLWLIRKRILQKTVYQDIYCTMCWNKDTHTVFFIFSQYKK